MLENRRILVGVCGSIAAYKAAEVVRGLTREGADVRVVMTEAATRFVAPVALAALSEHPVHVDLFEEPERVRHVELARWSEVFVVVGATASSLSRFASGSGEELVSATYLMCRRPVIVAPAMHTEMWEHPAVRRSVETVASDGAVFVGPESGPLASGDSGLGRLADPGRIVEAVRRAFAPQDLEGVRVLVTAGPTREPFDPVRYVSNRSSGRMGYALAAEAHRRGASVILVTGPATVPAPEVDEIVAVETTEEMYEACLEHFEDADVVIKAAAVADWRPAVRPQHKEKKSGDRREIPLEPTPDIADELGRKKGRQLLVLFAAETTDLVEHTREKLVSKNADLVVGNLVGRPGTGFDSDTNEAVLVSADGAEPLPKLSKTDLSARILDRVVGLLAPRRT